MIEAPPRRGFPDGGLSALRAEPDGSRPRRAYLDWARGIAVLIMGLLPNALMILAAEAIVKTLAF